MRSTWKVLATTLCVTLAGCGAATGSPSAAAPGIPAAPIATSGASGTSGPSAAPSAPEGQSATVAGTRDKTPIPAVRADALAKAWTARWHTDLEVVQNDIVRVRRTTVDYPAGHGKLTVGVQQEGTGTDPSPSLVQCSLRDNSLADKYVTLTRGLTNRLITDCWGAVLEKGEAAQITAWVLANDKPDKFGVNKTHAFTRFAVRLQIVPTSASFYMLAK